MDPPVAVEVETKSEKTDETKGSPETYECGFFDTEVVYKIAQELLPGLGSASVDNTTGGIFKNAGTVAADMRKEMVDYLTQRSESYVAEFLLTENASSLLDVSEHPYDIILTLIDDFAASKRNMFSRVSEWVLSDRREDRIDDFVQELEINGFWLLARRECVASMLLKNVDYKNAFHCNMVCNSEKEVAEHRAECKFRPIDCTNEGCTTRYCAAQKEHHEAVCPFMILPCEQKCSDLVMRREMDRHCVTICPMKLVNCAFYTIGCQSSIPRCNVQQHNADNLSSHLLYIIKTAHKEAADEDLKQRVEQILNLSNTEKLARARDARALTYLIKDAEAKLGPLKVQTGESNEKPATQPSSTGQPVVVKDGSDSPSKKEEHPLLANEVIRSSTEKPAISEDDTKQVHSESAKPAETAITKEGSVKSKDENESSSSRMKEEDKHMNVQGEESKGSAAKEEEHETTRGEKTEESKKSPKKETTRDSFRSDHEDEMFKKSPKKETTRESFRSDHEEEVFKKETTRESFRSDHENEFKKSPKQEHSQRSFSSDQEDTKKSLEKEIPEDSSPGREKAYASCVGSDDEESMKTPPPS